MTTEDTGARGEMRKYKTLGAEGARGGSGAGCGSGGGRCWTTEADQTTKWIKSKEDITLSDYIASIGVDLDGKDGTGVKYDNGKPPFSWISDIATQEEAKVLAFGGRKYAKDNWRKGMAWSRLLDAALRHVHAFNAGEDLDPDSGLSHLAHARCNLGFLLEFTHTHPELDDRYKLPNK